MNEPNWGPNGLQVYERTYRRIKEDGQPEQWLDTVTRVVDGNLGLIDDKHHEKDEREKLIDLFYNFKALPAGRHLWMSGVPGRQFLMNPVTGDTPVTTQDGDTPIKELVGNTVPVLSMGDNVDFAQRKWSSVGAWRDATFIDSGLQRIYEVNFASGRVIRSTAEHEWYSSKSRTRLKTTELEGADVPVMVPPRPDEDADFWVGLMWGYAFGDGNHDSAGNTVVKIYGQAIEDIVPIYEKFGHKTSIQGDGSNAYVGRLPSHWANQLPNLSESASLWRGFFAGWHAADGTVTKKGTVMLFNKSEEILLRARNGFRKAGLLPSESPVLCRKDNPFTGEEGFPLYRLSFFRSTVHENDLMLSHHRERFLATPVGVNVKTDKVVSVIDTEQYEQVFCCIQPETRSWTADGVITGNCWHAGWTEDVTSHFSFTFDQLMQGGGVGANYSNEYINQYGPVRHSVDVHIVCDPDHPDYYELLKMGVLSTEYSYEWGGATRIDDSREGWSEALATLLDAFWNCVEVLVLDVSLVRHKGTKIKTFGGTAAGPMPLAKLLTQTAKLLSERVGQQITSLDAMLIDHWIGECVVSGNVRRSARMSIKNWADEDIFDFINCKENSGEHWSTNISIEIDDNFFTALKHGDEHASAVYKAAMTGMLTNGEPGFYNRSLAEVGETHPVSSTNPCGEVTLNEWEYCCLGHVNLDFFYNDFEGAVEAHRLMTRFLLRATFGDIPNPLSQEVGNRNRRIGVGHFGFHGWLVKQGIRFSDSHRNRYVRKTLRDFYNAVRKEARRYAFQLRVPEPIKVTTVAPTGTISKLAGRTEGIHPILFKYYINRVRFSTVDPSQILQLEEFERDGYNIEDDIYTPNTKVVSFIAKNGLLDEVAELGYDADTLIEAANDIPLADMLAVQAMYQEYYADNAISFTVNANAHWSQVLNIQEQVDVGVPAHELKMSPPPEDAVEEAMNTLIHYLPSLKGTTLMVDGSRPQSPYEALTKAQYEGYQVYQMVTVGDGIGDDCVQGSCPIR